MYDKIMVVAHPDDEIIFGGAELIKENGWKVVCVTNGDNGIRAKEFKKAMELTGVMHFEIWNYKDEYGDFDRPSLTKDLQRVLNENTYKKIVTHNLNGEYGHSQHKALSEIMHSLVKENLYVFETEIEILPLELLNKKFIILTAYESQKIAVNDLRKYIETETIKKIR